MSRPFYRGYTSGPRNGYTGAEHRKIKSVMRMNILESPGYYKKHLLINVRHYQAIDNYLRWEFRDLDLLSVTLLAMNNTLSLSWISRW